MARLWTAVLFLSAIMMVAAAQASEPEAKDVARNANCLPGKLEKLKVVAGREGEVVYKVACTGQKDQFVVVQCRGRNCVLLR